jgi:hypothetical protein
MRFADKTDYHRTLLYSFLCILDLKYATLRRANSWSAYTPLTRSDPFEARRHSQGDGVVVVVVSEHCSVC